jgi:carotenoid cleavage dioxygenase-like enzyme
MHPTFVGNKKEKSGFVFLNPPFTFRFDIKPCFAFHVANSFQDGDIVTVIATPTTEFDLDVLADDSSQKKKKKKMGSRLYRWDLDMKTGKTPRMTIILILTHTHR